jgi:hypothetical protein
MTGLPKETKRGKKLIQIRKEKDEKRKQYPPIFFGQIFIRGDHYSLYQY